MAKFKFWDGSQWQSVGGSGKRVVRFVVGTSTAGWIADDCDYLCDGTDDQEEIIQALTNLPEEGGELVILDGTYNITASINIPKDSVTLRGNGTVTILKRMYNSTGNTYGLITLEGRSNCKICDLQIDGNVDNYSSYNNSGIYLQLSSNNIVTGNTCNNNDHSGIYLYSSRNNIVTGNRCNDNDNSGIYLYSSSSSTVTGNRCNDNDYSGIYLYSSSNNNTVTGNTCDNNDYYGIFLNSSSNNNTVTGNTCNNNDNSGVYLRNSSNNSVTGNTCNNNDNSGIYLYSSSNNNTVTGNMCIRGTGQPSNYTAGQYTIKVDSSNYNLISSNNCMGKAITSVGGGLGNSVWCNKYDALLTAGRVIISDSDPGSSDGVDGDIWLKWV